MSYGLQIINGANKVIIDDSLISLIKGASGTASPSHQSGDSTTVASSGGKGGSAYTSTFPYSDEVWGGTRKTLYYYHMTNLNFPAAISSPLFIHMNVGDEVMFGRVARCDANGQPNNGEIFASSYIISTRSTLPWSTIQQRDINTLPTGFGMAVYSPDGKCRWSAADQLAWIPYFRAVFPTHVSSAINKTYGGWIYSKIPSYWGFDGPGATTIYGRFVRTSAAVLDYIVNPYYATTYPGYPGEPTPSAFTGWTPPVMLGTLG